MTRTPWLCGLLATAALGCGPSSTQGQSPQHHVFLRHAVENATRTRVTLPLYRGTSHGGAVYYVITDASTRAAADRYGVNYAPKLANTAGGHGSQRVTGTPETGVDFPATVDFSPRRLISVGDFGQCATLGFLPFGPMCFAPGAVGADGYSPLIELADGTVLNASHVENASGHADKATVAANHATVTFDETRGFAFGHPVFYFSTDASVAPGAVLENVTYAPLLAMTPFDHSTDNASHASSREGIIAFVNGQTGLDNPERQGLNSTIVDGPAFGSGSDFTDLSPPVPLNILQQIPDTGVDPGFPLYSPLWDVHFAKWQVPVAMRLHQTDYATVAHDPSVTNPSDGPFGAAGAVVANCPIVSTDAPSPTPR